MKKEIKYNCFFVLILVKKFIFYEKFFIIKEELIVLVKILEKKGCWNYDRFKSKNYRAIL